MKIKPQWTCTNEHGDKFFYYPALGWINSATGEAGGFDLTGVVEGLFVGSATHLWIVDDVARPLRYNFVQNDYSVYQNGDWVVVTGQGGLNDLRGLIVELSTPKVAASGPPEWVEHYGSAATTPSPSEGEVEVFYFLRSDAFQRGPSKVKDLLWTQEHGPVDIIRWRYAR